MFLLQKRWRAAALMLAPALVYGAYYYYTSAILKVGIARLPGEFNIWSFVKSYAAQLASFLDAGVGPSAWLKYALSLLSLSWMSIIAAIAATAWLWRLSQQQHSLKATNPVPATLLLAGCTAIALGAFGVFALTSSYPQVAFNLGDRVMIFGNLFLVSLVLHLARPAALTLLTAITVAAFLGISDHWRGWNGVISESAADIRALDVPIEPGETLFVRGLQYSRLGPMTHIDHFTANYVLRDVFALARSGERKFPTASFNPRLRLESDRLVDVKYGDRTAIGASIMLYDAERNTLTRVPRSEIKNQLAALPRELRHWTQLMGPGIVRDTILVLMPRLGYAYVDGVR